MLSLKSAPASLRDVKTSVRTIISSETNKFKHCKIHHARAVRTSLSNEQDESIAVLLATTTKQLYLIEADYKYVTMPKKSSQSQNNFKLVFGFGHKW